MQFNLKDMQARFNELKPQRDAIRDKTEPLRAKRDAIKQKAVADMASLDAQIKAAEDGLGPIKDEMALICRALNGKTGAVT